MKVKCVDNVNGVLSLTIGKEYEVLNEYLSEYRIMNDNGSKGLYNKDRFEVVENEQQIKLQCPTCIHFYLCKEVENWKRYCKEHIALREKSVLFDVEPSCRYYIDKSVLEKDKTEEVEVKKTTIDKKILDNFKKQPLVYTRPEKEVFNKNTKWDFKDQELNHVVENANNRIKKLNEDDFKWLLEQLINIK